MEKIKKEKQIFYDTKNTPFKWKDIKNLELEDDDIILFSYEEAYVSENNSYDAHYSGQIIRMIEETDEEFEERKIKIQKEKERLKKLRYESYLKLKEEFEKKEKTIFR